MLIHKGELVFAIHCGHNDLCFINRLFCQVSSICCFVTFWYPGHVPFQIPGHVPFQIQTLFMLKVFPNSKVCNQYLLMHFQLKTAKWLIVWIVRLIILENRKWFLISYLNSNTFHVESFIRFRSMQSIFVNAFLIKNG